MLENAAYLYRDFISFSNGQSKEQQKKMNADTTHKKQTIYNKHIIGNFMFADKSCNIRRLKPCKETKEIIERQFRHNANKQK